MRLEIPYGDGFLPVDTGMMNSIEHLSSKRAVAPIDLENRIFNEIESSGVLRDVATETRGDSDIVLVFDNPLQFAKPDIILNAVISSLKTRAIPLKSLSILLVLPPHARRNLETVMKKLGNPGAKECQIHVHDEKRSDLLQYMGDTPSSSIPVHLNSLYVQSSLRILVSSIRPSVFTGVSGGTTSIAHGLSGQQTLLRLQKQSVQNESRPFQINETLGESISSVADFCSPELSINAIHDNFGTTAQVVFGDLEESWNKATQIARDLSDVRVRQRADIAIVGAGGQGFDGTLYDALPSLYAGMAVTRTGGSVIFVAECSQGPGPDGFVNGVTSVQSEKELRVSVETNFEQGMDRSGFFWRILESRDLIICSRLRESLITEKFHTTPVRDPQEGLDLAVKRLGTNSKIALIENGTNMNPIISKK